MGAVGGAGSRGPKPVWAVCAKAGAVVRRRAKVRSRIMVVLVIG